jgi:hypothetical protein
MVPGNLDRRRVLATWLRLNHDEEGIALVLALLIMFALTIMLTGVIYMTAAAARDAHRSNAGQKASALAESGVNDALAVLNANYPTAYPGNRCLLNDQQTLSASFPGVPFGSCATSSPFAVTPDSSHPNETISFWGALRAKVPGVGTAWIVRATGSVPNPTGPNAAPVTRTLTVKVPMTIPTSSPGGNGVLDWVYSGQSATFTQSVQVSSPLYVNGDMTFQNTASVHAPLYVTGNVEFDNNGGIDGTKCPRPVPSGHPGCLYIGRNLTFNNQNNSAGSSTPGSELPGVHILGSCTYRTTVQSPQCGPDWSAVKVFGTPTPDHTFQPPPFPPMTTSNTPTQCMDTTHYSCLDFDQWYQAASPGPYDPCPGLNASVFDNDSTRNDSIDSLPGPTSFNLTPSTPYTCETLSGKLDWNPTGGTNHDGQLTIKGTVYIDGSAYIGPQSNKVYSYTGVGAIWLSGSFAMSGDMMCAALTSNGKHCDTNTANWHPTETALAIIANGNGYSGGPNPANVAIGDSADIKTAEYQGILAGTNTINMDTSSQVQGPIMSVNSAVTPSQSLNLTFPSLPFAPSSSPGQPPPKAVLLAPREYGG